MKNRNITKASKMLNDAKVDDKEYERVVANCIQHMVKWKKLHTKNELNLDNNEKIDTCKHSLSINMKILLDHVIKESEEERKFGCLPEMC